MSRAVAFNSGRPAPAPSGGGGASVGGSDTGDADDDKKRKIKWNTEPYLSIMKRAVELAMQGSSTTKVASQFTIPARTLRRYVAAERRANGDFSDMRGHGNTDDIPPHKLEHPMPHHPHPHAQAGQSSPAAKAAAARATEANADSATTTTDASAGGRARAASPGANPFARENLPSASRQQQHRHGRSQSPPLPHGRFFASPTPDSAGEGDPAVDAFVAGPASGRGGAGGGASSAGGGGSAGSGGPAGRGRPTSWKRNRFPSAESAGSAGSDAPHDRSRARLFSAAGAAESGSFAGLGSAGGGGAGGAGAGASLYRPVSPWDAEQLGAALSVPPAAGSRGEASGVGPVLDLPPEDFTTGYNWKEPLQLVAQIGDKGEGFGNPTRRLRAESIDLFRQAFESMADNEVVREFKRANSASGPEVFERLRKDSIELFLSALESTDTRNTFNDQARPLNTKAGSSPP